LAHAKDENAKKAKNEAEIIALNEPTYGERWLYCEG